MPGPGLDLAPDADVRLRLLGDFGLHWQGRPVPLTPGPQRLLACLALARRPVQRMTLAGTLWFDADSQRAGARLRSTLWRLPQPGDTRLVEAVDTRLRLDPRVAVDVREAEEGLATGSTPFSALTEDLLADWDDDWVQVARERYRQGRLHALERLCVRHREAGEYDLALQAGLAAVAGEPLRESAHQQVIETHLAEGNPAEALRQYDVCRRLLRAEVGLPPSPGLRALVAGLLGRPVDAPVDAPAP